MEKDGTVPDIWRLNSEVKVLVHGWNPMSPNALEGQSFFKLAKEFGNYDRQLNIILVNWMYRSRTNLHEYEKAVKGSRVAVAEITKFLQKLRDKRKIGNFSLVHCLGFSLGAHICGMVGYKIQQANKGTKFGRITGLDPAGPSFSSPSGSWPSDLTGVLDYTDAEFVDIIHTNMGTGSIHDVLLSGRLGSSLQSGHTDFYPNGGEDQIFQCNGVSNRVDLCSHLASVLFYALSLKYPTFYMACPCKNYVLFMLGFCACTLSGSGVLLGELATKKTDGSKYYITINSQFTELGVGS